MVVHCSRLVASTSFTAGQVRLHLAQRGGSAAGAVSGALETRQRHGWELKPLRKMVGSWKLPILWLGISKVIYIYTYEPCMDQYGAVSHDV